MKVGLPEHALSLRRVRIELMKKPESFEGRNLFANTAFRILGDAYWRSE
jgi:hypothetical protein